jgi:long-chain fatty acid transport protein
LKSRLLLLLVLSTLITTDIFAGGFQLNIRGAKAVAMGGAFTAIADDPSAVYWNAAGLSFLQGTNIMLSSHLVAPQTSFRGVSPQVDRYRSENRVFFPTHLFVSHSINDQWSVGLGFTQPFGLGTTWDEDWPGKYLAIETGLTTYVISPVVSFKPFKTLSVSAGFLYGFATVKITRKSPLSSLFADDAFVELEGSDKFAYGFNAGLMFRPTDFISIGATYSSEMEYEFDGTATTMAPSQFASQVPSGNITATLTTPQNIAAGIAVDITKELKLSAEYQYIGWSSYDTLAVNFEDNAFTDIASPRLYNNSYILRFGVYYRLNEQVGLMGGFYFDNMPVDPENLNPSLADSDRLGFSAGIDAQLFEKLKIVGSYLFISAKELTVDNSTQVYTPGGSKFNGTYNSIANIFSLSFIYSL